MRIAPRKPPDRVIGANAAGRDPEHGLAASVEEGRHARRHHPRPRRRRPRGRVRRPHRRPAAHRLVDRRDAGPRRHPRGRHPVRVHRRRHRLLRHRRLPAHLRCAPLGDPGVHPARHALGELRVPHPRLPDPARRAAAQRLGVLPGQHLGLPELRAARGDGDAVAQAVGARARGAALRRLLDAEGGAGVRLDGAGVPPDPLPGDGGQGPGPHGAQADGRRLLHDPHPARGRHPHQARGVPQPVRARRRGLPRAEVPARPHGLPRDLPRLRQRRQRLRAARADLRAAAPRAGHRARARRRHRRLARVATADRRPRRARALHPDPARVPHVRRRPARPARVDAQTRRRRLGLPGLQLPEVGVGRAAQGPHAQARRPGPRRRSTSCSAAPTPRSAGAGRRRCAGDGRRAGTGPSRARSRRWSPARNGTVAGAAEDRDGARAGAGHRGDRLHRAGGRHPRAPGARRPARPRRGGPQPVAAPRRGAHVRGARHAQRAGPPVRLGHGHAGWLLPRRRHLPRAADRGAGDRRRPRRPRASARRSARCGR